MRRTTMRSSVAACCVGVLLIACSCQPANVRARALNKGSGEGEVEMEGPNKPQHLGGLIDPGTPPQKFSGRKTPGLGDYIERLNDSALVAYLNTLVYDNDPKTTEIETVACVHSNDGSPCATGETAQLLIQPEIGAHKWKHSDVKSHGLVVARIINYSTGVNEKNFGFPERSKVWWVVDEDPATHLPRSRFFKRTYRTTAPFVEQVGPTRAYYDCGHSHDRGGHGEAIAKYVSCSQSLTMEPGAPGAPAAAELPVRDGFALLRLVSSRATLRQPSRVVAMELTATWITCEMGCCSTTR